MRHSRRRAGFTMLEAIVALSIVALVCVGVLGAYGGALRADVVAAERLPLATLAEERVATIDLYSGSLGRLPDSLARGTYARPYAGATWQVDVERVNGLVGLFDIVVRIEDRGDRFTLRTRRYRPVAVGVAQ